MNVWENIPFWYGLNDRLPNAASLRRLYFWIRKLGIQESDELLRVLQRDNSHSFKNYLSQVNMVLYHLNDYEHEVKKLLLDGIFVLTYSDKRYPLRLKELIDPPVLLFLQGNPALINSKTFGMVGSRTCTSYGLKATALFARPLAQRGFTIVSGLAYGIDHEAHAQTLMVSGKTIAVLGNGLAHVYPAKHFRLQQQIAKEGLLVSEYHPDQKPRPFHFPERNRIIAGLSDRIMVVEAAIKSGSLITAQFALDLGKEIYAVPGNIDQKNSAGTNRLLQDGALMALSAEELL